MIKATSQDPNPTGLCQCGCGRKTPLATRTEQRLRMVRGKPLRYCSGHGEQQPSYEPTPEEIAAACAEIRKTWTARVENGRIVDDHYRREPVELTVLHVSPAVNAMFNVRRDGG